MSIAARIGAGVLRVLATVVVCAALALLVAIAAAILFVIFA